MPQLSGAALVNPASSIGRSWAAQLPTLLGAVAALPAGAQAAAYDALAAPILAGISTGELLRAGVRARVRVRARARARARVRVRPRLQVRVLGVGLVDVRVQQLCGRHEGGGNAAVATHVAVVPHLDDDLP